ncbi:MAG: hypothetical protein DDT39_00013 [Firmicutes bacterium]|nr:hypothetical protein [candidate division NPL-UPA2 bacterium]
MNERISLHNARELWRTNAMPLAETTSDELQASWRAYTAELVADGMLSPLQHAHAPAHNDPMPPTGPRYDPLSGDKAHILHRLLHTIRCEFVPFSQSRRAGEKQPSLNWLARVDFRDRNVLTTDYSQGSAHAPAYTRFSEHSDGRRDAYATNLRIAAECETGKDSLTREKITPPAASDILHSLLLDASVIDYATFEQWASEYGYNTDSRAAERIYRDCLEIALKLRATLGEPLMRDLRDLLAND